jgi:prolyl-tRNA editing enzyme YbaK/EbsC (Cys-tRNA(Pro) deacylase)
MEGVMKGALDIHRELLSRDVPHEILRLPRVVLDADQLAEVLGVDAEQTVKVRLYMAGGQMIALAVPSGRATQPEALLRAAGSRTVRPATAQEVNESTEYAAGLVAPLLLPKDMPLFVDARIGRHEVVYTATGDTGTALGIATADLLVASAARIADLTTVSLIDIVHDLEV